jgi:UDP-N-acetylglucosamine diphosphorylase / glucose-1-phosphate thymidylyltransferase / UDP-N-acetylgalactosamine diphosphorylase / glucosamine-1-phosphate N-acetyltransferase / galactosamine-1-phosphate N-acetyltransferase
MQTVILAAGKGTRMRPLTYDIPKPMLRIGGKPILEYTLGFLPKEIDEVVFVVNYLGSHIKDYFGDTFGGRKITYVHQDELDGTGGAVMKCKDVVTGKFLVLNGDDLYHRDDLAEMIRHPFSILAKQVDDCSRFGVFKIDEHHHLVDIIEKPEDGGPGLANIGAYVIDKTFFDYPLVPISKTEFGLPQTLAQMAQCEKIKIIKACDWFPIGNPDDLGRAEEAIKRFV